MPRDGNGENAWYKRGFAEAERKEWMAEGFTAAQASHWRKKGFRAVEAAAWFAHDFNPTSAALWAEAGLSLPTAIYMRAQGRGPKRSAALIRRGYPIPMQVAGEVENA